MLQAMKAAQTCASLLLYFTVINIPEIEPVHMSRKIREIFEISRHI